MAERVTIARPYARAAFEQAKEDGMLAQWSQMLANAATVISDPDAAAAIADPRIDTADVAGVVIAACGADAGERGANFIRLLAEQHRLDLLPEIAGLFAAYRADEERVVDVDVTSAFELDEGDRSKLAAGLQRRLGREVRLHCEIDKDLIGGVVVRAGDLVIDGSVRDRLAKMAENITA
jgi:F-type H+-transporting ATPase subunit delta